MRASSRCRVLKRENQWCCSKTLLSGCVVISRVHLCVLLKDSESFNISIRRLHVTSSSPRHLHCHSRLSRESSGIP